MQPLDIALWICGGALVLAFIYLIYSYVQGLKGSPRELYILFITKVIEYTAYGAMNLSFILFLSADCKLGDISAGTYIGIWSMALTLTMIFVGAVVDAIGIKKTLLVGTVFLLFSRIFMPFITNLALVTMLGFLPMAVGIAIMGPVLSVGIKRYTTKANVAMGFALFYTLMNVGWALGAALFDEIRGFFGEYEIYQLPVTGGISTYQIIFLAGFLLTIPTLFLVLVMRDRVRMTEDKGVVIDPPEKGEESHGMIQSILSTMKKAGIDTGKILYKVVREKTFWYFIFMLGLLVFVRLVFYHFHYTFPKYGIRVLGEGVKIGNIFGVLNPVMIVFLVPLFGALTKKVSSYKMMMIGTTVSAFSVFLATLPDDFFQFLMGTWVQELIMERWLNVPILQQHPYFLTLVFFIAIFTVGEALWSPRLMQFTAEIAPKGKEGSYIALSYLPYFASKLLVGPMSGWLVATYTSETVLNYKGSGVSSFPGHFWVWIWIGGMAIISPIGLVIFHKLFTRAERESERDMGDVENEEEKKSE